MVITDKRIEGPEHKKFVAAEIDKRGAVIKAAGTYADLSIHPTGLRTQPCQHLPTASASHDVLRLLSWQRMACLQD